MGFVDDRIVDYPRASGAAAARAADAGRNERSGDQGERPAGPAPAVGDVEAQSDEAGVVSLHRFHGQADDRRRSQRVLQRHASPSCTCTRSTFPQTWLADVTLPTRGRRSAARVARSRRSCGWFDERGIEFFEPLEIWHLPSLHREFRRRTGRNPRPDRSYRPPRLVRAQRLGRRVFNAVKRRILP